MWAVCPASQQIANGIGHQDADHPYLPKISMANQALRFRSMRRVMPWATDQKLATMLLCHLYQFRGFRNCQRHRLFNQHVLAMRQSCKGVSVMKTRAAADYDCRNALDGKQFIWRSTGERNTKILSNLL